MTAMTPASIAVVGAGRVGSAIVRALSDSELKIYGPFGRDELPLPVDVVLICVPDDQISVAAATVAGAAPYVGHVSGATPLTALVAAGGAGFGIHPLQTFVGNDEPERFQGVGCAIAGTSQDALRVAATLAKALGMNPFHISDDSRAAYHAAACVSSNYLVTLLDSAERIASAAGLEPEQSRMLLAPLVETAVRNWRDLGPGKALTGPVSRGDQQVVSRQRAAVSELDPDLTELFDVLTRLTMKLATKEQRR